MIPISAGSSSNAKSGELIVDAAPTKATKAPATDQPISAFLILFSKLSSFLSPDTHHSERQPKYVLWGVKYEM